MAKSRKGIGCLAIAVILIVIGVVGYGFFKGAYNKFVTLDEDVNQKWAQVQNVLQRRMDLIPNLVETVKGYAAHERETLEAVINARAKASQIQVNAEDLANNPELLNQYMEAQNGLNSALNRLMVVVEQYPNLKANENFIRLQDELAGTENRISVERGRYNESVQIYNQHIRVFPNNLLAGLFNFDKRAYFDAPPEAQQAPKVDFGTSS
ncbi:LemA family protein [candidate division KSB1 bacterium]|nr:LemA family protein [candidate division KSB1 bacterium]RQW03412.1 MAG: LemA family protein [candidate division KSB1 bacterium]